MCPWHAVLMEALQKSNLSFHHVNSTEKTQAIRLRDKHLQQNLAPQYHVFYKTHPAAPSWQKASKSRTCSLRRSHHSFWVSFLCSGTRLLEGKDLLCLHTQQGILRNVLTHQDSRATSSCRQVIFIVGGVLFPGRPVELLLWNTADMPQFQQASADSNQECCGWLGQAEVERSPTPASLCHWKGHFNLTEDWLLGGHWHVGFHFPKASSSCDSKPSTIKQLTRDHPGIQPKGGLHSSLYGSFIEGSFKGPLQSPV